MSDQNRRAPVAMPASDSSVSPMVDADAPSSDSAWDSGWSRTELELLSCRDICREGPTRIVTACAGAAYKVMAYIVMAYIVMACAKGRHV